jgi:hypothetical protein
MNPALYGAIFAATQMMNRNRREREREELRDSMVRQINDWWDGWHRFAEEDDLPPTYIEDMMYKLNKEYGMKFDHMSGKWSDSNK